MAAAAAQVIRVWARILAAMPTARLLLKNKPFACESARSHTLGLLAAEVCMRHPLSRPRPAPMSPRGSRDTPGSP